MAACSDMKELSPAKVRANSVGGVCCEAHGFEAVEQILAAGDEDCFQPISDTFL